MNAHRTILVMLAAVSSILVSTASVRAHETHAQTGQEVELSTEAMTALVVAIDKQDRTVTLLGSRGEAVIFEVGQAVKHFDQIKVGDYLEVEYYESVALYIGDHGTQPKTDAGSIVARGPKGERPAGVAIGAIDLSAQVQHIDRRRRTVTLKGHDGHSVTVKVDKRLKAFESLRAGDLIHARLTEAIAVSLEPAIPEDQADGVSLLFVQNAQGIYYDAGANTLTLEGVAPAVVFFADRPYRIAGHVLLPAFLQLWNEGADSFKADPPNATLSVLASGQVESAVVEIANPRLTNDRLTYDVLEVLEGNPPASGGVTSLFIDGLFDGGLVGGGAKGAAGGALIGAISGDAGKGAAIGAGVGVLGGGIRQAKQREAAANAQLTTRVINVSNANGSFTPVTLRLVQSGWQGPRGEIYPTLPTVGQLEPAYGIR